MSSSAEEQSRVQGTVAPGFESVKRVYEHEMETMAEKNTQLCGYYKGEKVGDLWASAKARIVDYWPEFAANDKGELTVAE